MMITWSLQMIIVLVYIHMHVSNACITVEHDDGSQSVCNQTMTISCTDLKCALPEMKSGSKMIIGVGDNYTLSYVDAMTMSGMNSIVIVGEGSDNTVIMCDSNAGLAFINMNDITIANLTLKECGALRNSTTQNGTEDYTLKFHCGLYFLNCSDVTMYDVIVTDSPGTGVMMYDTLGTVTIANSQFMHNRVPTNDVGNVPGGGGVYIEFTYCLPNTTDFDNCRPTQQGNANYLINNCTFLDNTATTVEENTTRYILTVGSNHQQFGRGGGLSIFFKGKTTTNTFTIKNCNTSNNEAIWGGGILIQLLDSAQNNNIIIKEVRFINNTIPYKTGTGGGGIKINFFPQVDSPSNIVSITDCIFDHNSAYFGGATVLMIEREQKVFNATNKITFNHCKWKDNFGHIGSAIDLSSYTDEPGDIFVIPAFKNCSFIGNKNIEMNNMIGLGTFHSDEVSISIEDDNYFMDSNGTALIVIHAVLKFKENASATFTDNGGYRGGAMALWGNTWLDMYPNTRVVFIRNKADDKGGAIYYNSAGIRYVNSRKCFIRFHNYSVPPNKWNTNFTFINNTSQNPGHAIYCTTLLTCSRNDTSIIANQDPEVMKETFRWNNIFTYTVDNNNTIATDPADVDIDIKKLEVAPGELYPLDLSISDDLDVPRNTVLFAHVDNNTAVNIASTSTYISDNHVKILGSPGESFRLDFNSITTRVLSFSINATLAKCPPGFYIPEGDSPISECKCSASDKNERYKHILRCERTTLQAFLQPQYWAGYIPCKNDSVLVTGKCPLGYCHSNGSNELELPTKADPLKLCALICSPKNRCGTLCGRCKQGYHIYANGKDYVYKCGNCSTIKYGIVIQIFAKYVPLTLFLITIMLLDINLASGLLNTFVFFSQMLPSLDLYAGGEIPIADAAKPFVEFYRFFYGIFNLQYFESLDSVPGWCTLKYDSAIKGVMYDYIVAFWPLVFIFIVWLIIFSSDYCVCRNVRKFFCCFNVLRQLYQRIKPEDMSLSKSFFRGLVTFILLSYTKFTLISLTILTPAYLYSPEGEDCDVVVVNLDGTLKFFGGDHLYYAIPAIFVLVFIVLLPLILFATYPCMCNQLGIPVNKMMHFFDTLNGAFKNEHKLHYFSLLYFVYRIVLVAIFTFAPEVQLRYMLQQVFTGIVLIVHIIAQPYKDKKYNIIDLCLLALIPTVISISSFQLFRVTNSDGVVQFAMAIQIILLYIPLIYLAVVIVYKLYLWRRRRGYMDIDNNAGANQLLELSTNATDAHRGYQAEHVYDH